jgi:hypothetical protein
MQYFSTRIRLTDISSSAIDMEVVMLSLFLRNRNNAPEAPGPDPVPERDGDLHRITEHTDASVETASDIEVDMPSGDISDMLSAITANAEFLEVLYGENRYLKTILKAAGKAKKQLQETHECHE